MTLVVICPGTNHGSHSMTSEAVRRLIVPKCATAISVPSLLAQSTPLRPLPKSGSAVQRARRSTRPTQQTRASEWWYLGSMRKRWLSFPTPRYRSRSTGFPLPAGDVEPEPEEDPLPKLSIGREKNHPHRRVPQRPPAPIPPPPREVDYDAGLPPPGRDPDPVRFRGGRSRRACVRVLFGGHKGICIFICSALPDLDWLAILQTLSGSSPDSDDSTVYSTIFAVTSVTIVARGSAALRPVLSPLLRPVVLMHRLSSTFGSFGTLFCFKACRADISCDCIISSATPFARFIERHTLARHAFWVTLFPIVALAVVLGQSEVRCRRYAAIRRATACGGEAEDFPVAGRGVTIDPPKGRPATRA